MQSQEFRADLHCHSTCSDGTMAPKELVEHASEIGLNALSITDHDTIASYTEAIPAAHDFGIELLTGAEFSCVHRGTSIHLLAYAFPVDSGPISELCDRHRKRRYERCIAILNRLQEHGMVISENDLFGKNSDISRRVIGRPHIALAMVKKGYVDSMRQAFDRYLGDGNCAFVPGPSFSVEDTIDVIHKGNGLAVIAHPMLIKDQRHLKEILQLKVDGIEGYYASFSYRVEQQFQKLAEKYGLFVTGGSDFHGDLKPHNHLGSSWTPERTFRMLMDHLKQHSN